MSQVSYRALGPLASLKLGTSPGLVETRTWDSRNFINRIQAGTLMDWDYTLDGIGNPTAISGTINGVSFAPTFSYQDSLYFLTQTDGPWGNRTWTYDKIGNRLSFARTSEPTQAYGYTSHNPKLQSVTPAPGWGTGSWAFSYDAAGNQTQLLESNDEGSLQTTFFDMAADSRMNALRTSNGPMRTDMLYDGRGFLRQAAATVSPPGDFITETPVYSSDGTLYASTEARRWSGGTGGNGEDDPTFVATSTDAVDLFYFAGRPVAQLTNESDLLYLTTDHLGTPVLATTSSGGVAWAGALEPFGQTWTAGVDNTDGQSLSGGPTQRRFASAGKRTTPPGVLGTPGPPATSKLSPEKVFLRYPGQWVSDAFRVTSTQQDLYYNVHRWYEPMTGRYSQVDPLGIVDRNVGPSTQGVRSAYAYAESNPIVRFDPLALKSRVCCRKIPFVGLFGFRHCYMEIQTDKGRSTCGLFGGPASGEPPGQGRISPNTDFDHGGDCGDWNESCEADQCAVASAGGYNNPSIYRFSSGPNSNTFAGTVARACDLKPPSVVGWRTPGWSQPPAGRAIESNGPFGTLLQPEPVRCRLP